jgi:hypothetical protein
MSRKFVVTINNSKWSISYIGLGDHGNPIVAPITIDPLEIHYDDTVERREELFIRIQRWLENVYTDILRNDDSYLDFQRLFSDLAMMKTGAVKSFVEIHVDKDNSSAQNVDFVLTFYKAISLFLEKDNRLIDLNAYILHLYCTWQWYALQKYVLVDHKYNSKENSLIRDFSAAYKKINDILSNDDYTYAIQYFVKWFSSNLRKSPILREHLKISLVLWAPGKKYDYFSEEPILYEFSSENSMINWEKTILHPVYSTDRGAQKAVRTTMTQYTFPRYDLETSLNLARLLKNNHPTTNRRTRIGPIPLAFLVICGVILAGTLANNILPPQFHWKNDITNGIALSELLVLTCLTFKTIRKYDLLSFVQLTAPRIFGGAMIGYLTILLQKDSTTFNNSLHDSLYPLPVIFLWIIVIVIGFGYLYFDIYPKVRDQKISRTRAKTILLLSLFITTVSGMAVLPIVTRMYPADCLSIFCSIELLSPLGFINFSYTLTFIPLALLTGLVTQFIFEERTVTAPIWSPEEN